MQHAIRPIRLEVYRLIAHYQETVEHELNHVEQEFLATTMEDFVHTAVEKYIRGSKEHGEGFLTEVDHVREIKAETIDLLFYSAGAAYKKAKQLNQ